MLWLWCFVGALILTEACRGPNGVRKKDGEEWIHDNSFRIRCVFIPNGWKTQTMACLSPKGTSIPLNSEITEDQVRYQCIAEGERSTRLKTSGWYPGPVGGTGGNTGNSYPVRGGSNNNVVGSPAVRPTGSQGPTYVVGIPTGTDSNPNSLSNSNFRPTGCNVIGLPDRAVTGQQPTGLIGGNGNTLSTKPPSSYTTIGPRPGGPTGVTEVYEMIAMPPNSNQGGSGYIPVGGSEGSLQPPTALCTVGDTRNEKEGNLGGFVFKCVLENGCARWRITHCLSPSGDKITLGEELKRDNRSYTCVAKMDGTGGAKLYVKGCPPDTDNSTPAPHTPDPYIPPTPPLPPPPPPTPPPPQPPDATPVGMSNPDIPVSNNNNNYYPTPAHALKALPKVISRDCNSKCRYEGLDVCDGDEIELKTFPAGETRAKCQHPKMEEYCIVESPAHQNQNRYILAAGTYTSVNGWILVCAEFEGGVELEPGNTAPNTQEWRQTLAEYGYSHRNPKIH